MPTFCRHNRFIERCPICRETVPGFAKRSSSSGGSRGSGGPRVAKPARSGSGAGTQSKRAGPRGGQQLRVYSDEHRRGGDDGFRSGLAPGLRSLADAERLAGEIGFAASRLAALASDPPSLYGEARAGTDIEQATWICLLAAYLCPLEGSNPFAGIRAALDPPSGRSWISGELPELDGVPLGPMSSHDLRHGNQTLRAYRHWVDRAGSQAEAFRGDPGWTPERRFGRIFERLALPGLTRFARYELLVTLGRLGLYELRGDSLQLSSAASPGRGSAPEGAGELTLLAAKRVFGIGDPLILERRALALAEASDVPVEALDLALANWNARERATLGFSAAASDEDGAARVRAALGA